ncbi:D-glycero-alpha-D-manno-heptose-1,7-bisphosphate 7-phosphatase [Fulvivirga sedimenti]|uniref:D,D-heptose 1,7-bisphosphate phosphatase n=1 Tax=Fulvivirga sedimenti TaxID=2879465 RepID=A0A9X1KVW0_9BACT|nr:HAD-IIIA family hydrolase [Fulvivirga sedimenti]MCA6075258.1 HAD-IIIA family hydrolase [Fulvivirga sedimenti]MCA6076435.1 HAD-IIIA family hydrolase [Fulvivirga sedimenti]MCA6077563.1 HAD-IIIA family hydrolase [Fulvivirga sedimenti]
MIQLRNKYVLLDRDGVINMDRDDYVYSPDHFVFIPGAVDAMKDLHRAGYGLIVITNQAGIAKGLYKREDMELCHNIIREATGGIIEHFYYSPWHPVLTESLTRKPGSLLFEKALARYHFDVRYSWMIGDKDRDLVPAKKIGLNTIQVKYANSVNADHYAENLREAAGLILEKA